MARHESDHEDLMRDAASLVRRIECQYQSRQQPCLFGFNAFGWFFVYLGTDPMYRFDEQGRLRRAFVDGELFRTQGHTMARLKRQRELLPGELQTNSRSQLLRRDLTPDELKAFLTRMRRELTELSEGLNDAKIVRQHPAEDLRLGEDVQRALRVVLESKTVLAPAIVCR